MNPVNESAIQRAIASDPLAGTREGWDRDIAEGYHNCPQCGQGHQSEDQGLIGRLRLYLKGVVEQRDELAASIIEMAPRTDVVFVQAKRMRRERDALIRALKLVAHLPSNDKGNYNLTPRLILDGGSAGMWSMPAEAFGDDWDYLTSALAE